MGAVLPQSLGAFQVEMKELQTEARRFEPAYLVYFPIMNHPSQVCHLYAPTHDLIAQQPLILTHSHSSPRSTTLRGSLAKRRDDGSHDLDLRNMPDPFPGRFQVFDHPCIRPYFQNITLTANNNVSCYANPQPQLTESINSVGVRGAPVFRNPFPVPMHQSRSR
jgi:hypothetical protein